MSSKITPHNTPEELNRLAHLKRNADISDRIHAIRMAMQGMPPSEIATLLGYQQAWFFRWRKRYNEQGLDGLRDRPRPGQPKKLGDADRLKLRKMIDKGPSMKRDGVSTWTGPAMAALIERHFGVRYSLNGVYKVCHDMGLSWITPRARHPKSDPEKQRRWKEEEYPLPSRKSKRSTRRRRS